MGYSLEENKLQGNLVGEWQLFYLKHTEGFEVCYLQKNGMYGIETAFNFNYKDNYPKKDDIEFNSSNELLVGIVDFVDDNFDTFL